MSTDAERLIRRLYQEVWNEGNDEAVAELLAEDFVHRGNIAPDGTTGPGGYREFVQEIVAAFPDTCVELVTVVGEDRTVAARWVAHGTHEGAYFGIEPTGRRVSTNGVSFAEVEVEDGVIRELWDLYDTHALLSQVGVLDEE